MNTPIMRRGLSPEGRKIRERHQGSLTIGIQGITVHPAERSRGQRDFLQDNVKRLKEIQARCKERDSSKKSQPLRATRDSSASTSSSLRQADSLAPLRNGSAKLHRRSQNSEREGSAHSDYFSLVEEQIEPLSLRHHGQGLFQQDGSNESLNSILNNSEPRHDGVESVLGHHTRSPSSLSQTYPGNMQNSSLQGNQRQRPGSPSRLQPLSHQPFQTTIATNTPALRQDLTDVQALPSEYTLTHGMRKSRMDSLMSKIKSQKPACDMDFNTHYKTIESQHRMLLDNADVLSLYGSSDGCLQNGNDSHRSPKKVNENVNGNKHLKMVRAHSFDRDLSNKRSEVAGKSSRLDSASNKNNMKNIPYSPSPLRKKKLSKSVSNLNPQNVMKVSTEESWRPAVDNKKNPSGLQESLHSPHTKSIERSKSNLERPRPLTAASVQQETELPYDRSRCLYKENMNFGSQPNAELNLNATLSSSCELNYPDHDQSYESRPEELQLNIHSESQSELNVVDGDAKEDSYQLPGGKESALSNNPSYRPSDIEIPQSNHEVNKSPEPEKTSTPVPNIKASMTPPSRKKREKVETQRSTLRRSQSLKNIKPQPFEPPPSYQRGKLPRYLLARKEEERRLAEIAKSVDPECPPGHAPLPEYERCNTLHLLRNSQAEVMRELSSLPVAQDTLRVKRKRHELEEKLMQIEDGLRIFSQPKVYVVNDD